MGVNLQNFKASLRTLFVTPSDLIDKPYDAFRVLLVVAILVVITSVLIGFTVFHLFISKLFDIAMINLMGIMVLVGLVYQVHLTKRVGWVGHVATVALLVFLPTFTAFNQNLDFGLIWLFFAPFVVVAFVGWRDAAIYLTLFYSVLLSMAFSAIGHWDSGNWSVLSFARLTVGLILGTALAMIVDVANSSMNRQIRLQRAKELSYSQTLRRLSTTDSLTNVYNRHYLNEVFEHKFKALKETDNYLTFFILDIDHLKLYNDQFGHVKGDEVLQKVAQTVRDYIKRQEDLVFRLGGEEFGGLLVTDNPGETSLWVSKLTEAVEQLQITHADASPQKVITISIGVFSAKVKDIDSMTALYSVADNALYQAKNQGRNQAVIIKPQDAL